MGDSRGLLKEILSLFVLNQPRRLGFEHSDESFYLFCVTHLALQCSDHLCVREESRDELKTAILSPRKDLDLDLILGIQSSAAFLSYQLVRAAVNYIHLQCKVSISYDQLSGFRL